jgi:hypothetical protein
LIGVKVGIANEKMSKTVYPAIFFVSGVCIIDF